MFKRRDEGTEVRAENLIDLRNGVCFGVRISGNKKDGDSGRCRRDGECLMWSNGPSSL